MKKLISLALIIASLLAIMPLTVFATSGTDGLVYTLSEDGTYYIVSGYEGEATEVVIPSEYEGLPVKEIGNTAFFSCQNLVSIEIPDSVITIGFNVFYKCTSLKNIALSDSVISIGTAAFGSCDNLESVTFGNSLESIGAYAFNPCPKLENIVIPDSVEKIGSSAFGHCTNLKSVIIGNSVKYIDDNCFYGCTSLENVILGESVSGANSNAFNGCDNLKYNIYDNAKYLGSESNPYKILVSAISKDITSVDVHAKTEFISAEVFSEFENLTDVYLPDSLKIIDDAAFFGCLNLKKINIPNSVTKIGEFAFALSGLEAVIIPKSVTEIDEGAFAACENLADIYCEADAQPEAWDETWNFYDENGAKATVHWGYESNSVKITTQPKNIAVQSGKQAKVTVTASGEGKTYKWYFKDKGATKFTLTNSFKGDSYYVEMNGTRAGRQVYCVITDKYGNELKTNTVTLGMAVKITKQPTTVSVQSGKQAKVTVSASGEGKTYKWYYKDKGASKFTLTNSFKGDSYYVEMNGTRAGRQIYCVITDKYGNSVKTNTVTLGMAVKITKQPVSVKVANGSQAKVTVSASGEGKTYKWYFKDKGATKFSLTNSFKGDSYYVTMTDARAGRQVYCVITDKYGNSEKTNTVTLNKK